VVSFINFTSADPIILCGNAKDVFRSTEKLRGLKNLVDRKILVAPKSISKSMCFFLVVGVKGRSTSKQLSSILVVGEETFVKAASDFVAQLVFETGHARVGARSSKWPTVVVHGFGRSTKWSLCSFLTGGALGAGEGSQSGWASPGRGPTCGQCEVGSGLFDAMATGRQ
jgi:hypothetical protein